MSEQNVQEEKEALIYDLLGISDYQFNNYIKNIATPPIFYYLMTRSNHELRQIMNDIKFVLKVQKIKEEEQKTPDLYTEKKVLLTQDLYLTLLHNDTIQSYFDRRKKEIDERKMEQKEAQIFEGSNTQIETIREKEEDEELNNLIKKFDRYFKKYTTITDNDDLKNELLIKMDHMFQNFPVCFLEDNIALIGQDRYEILPSAKALKQKIEKEYQNNHNVIDRINSQNFIYFYQTTLDNFLNYLQIHFFTLEHFEFEKAFEIIWEQIIQSWIDEEDSKEEIRSFFKGKELEFFRIKAGFIELRDEIVKKLYFFLQDECKKILETFNPQIS